LLSIPIQDAEKRSIHVPTHTRHLVAHPVIWQRKLIMPQAVWLEEDDLVLVGRPLQAAQKDEKFSGAWSRIVPGTLGWDMIYSKELQWSEWLAEASASNTPGEMNG